MKTTYCDRRDILKLAASAMTGAILPACSSVARGSDAERPNIILIMADDLGYGDLSCYDGWIQTPHIDALARAGMRFTDYHANGPVCSPTRAALLTGRYQQRCGIEEVVFANGPSRETGMPLKEVTFAEALRQRGYVTGIFGKWHLGYNVEFNPAKQGFDEFIGYVSGNVDYHSHIDGAGIDDWWKGERKTPEDGYTTDLITRHAIDFIERHKNEPFCLYVPHEAPHSPYQGRNDPPERLPGGGTGAKTQGPEIKRAYREMVEAMDQSVGRIVETVKKLGLERKTLTVFCSDNGATARGSNGLLHGFKGSLWEGGHRVPAIACWPGRIQPGTVCADATVLGMDLFPTMISLAGAKPPMGLALDGADLSPLLFRGDKPAERTLFWRYRDQRAVRLGFWKLLIQGDSVKLFDLSEDLGERNDLAGTKPGLVALLQARLAAWERDVGTKSNVERSIG